MAAHGETFAADVVVNASGAWGEQIGRMAGARAVGPVPKRRTAVLVPSNGIDVADWPVVHDVESEFYFKPDAGRMLLSPADETPSESRNAQPEEWGVAVVVDRFEEATTTRAVSTQLRSCLTRTGRRNSTIGAVAAIDRAQYSVGLSAPPSPYSRRVTRVDDPPDVVNV